MKHIALKFVFGILSVMVFFACSSRMKKARSNSTFSKEQLSMIMSADSSKPMRVFKINNYKDSLLLRKKSTSVKVDKEDIVLKTFVKRMYNTVTDSMSLGVGIAAPQVGILKRIIWVQRFDKDGFPYEVYLNPVITEYSEKKQPCPEGCLSIPDKQAVTKNRAHSINLEYDKMDGTHIKETVTSFTAVVFQHEIDHLDGILFIDHLEEEVKLAK